MSTPETVAAEALHRWYDSGGDWDKPDSDDHMQARAVLDALGANGYVVVPRHLLEELREATETIGVYWPGKPGYAVVKAAAAVVEAVGPTREDH
jgi:predicted aspartyl protease